MSWSTPRTWLTSETMTSTIFNQHIRDNMSVLKTQINDDGVISPVYASWEGSAANSGSSETTAWSTYLPANTLVDGNALHWFAWGTLTANTNAKTITLYNGTSSSLVVLNAYATSVANNRWVANMTCSRSEEGSNNARWYGTFTYGAASGAAPTILHYAVGPTGTMDWTVSNTIKLTLTGVSNSDLTLEGIVIEELL